ELAERVAEQGALLAEAPPNMPPMSGSFPQRNRIISGLSLGVLVIEAAERSGALITARHAAEQGRDAFALPGPVDSPASRGCHRLIQEGGKLVMSVDDVLEELEGLATLGPTVAAPPLKTRPSKTPMATPAPPTKPLPSFDAATQAVLDGVGRDPTSVDHLVEVTGQPVENVLAGISRL
ncbi:MAG: DNA-processing protein DprA, partial [Planctomycetota bacterium]